MIIQNFQFPVQKDLTDLDLLFLNIRKRVNKDLIHGFCPFLIGWVICIFSKIYSNLNRKFTRYENHVLENDFKLAYLKRNILFNFINYYSWFYYLLFMKIYKNKCPLNNCHYFMNLQVSGIYIGILIFKIIELLIE
jgi:hypothetical protein